MSTTQELKADFEAKALPYLPKLYRLAYVRLGLREDAEDIVQETYIKAFRSFKNYREGNFEAWLTTILLNTIRDSKRKASIRSEDYSVDVENPDHLLDFADTRPNPEEQLTAAEIDENLESALNSTPEWLLTPFLLKELQQLSYKEIANVLAIPIGTVMSRLSRARKHLCAKLSQSKLLHGHSNESERENQK